MVNKNLKLISKKGRQYYELFKHFRNPLLVSGAIGMDQNSLLFLSLRLAWVTQLRDSQLRIGEDTEMVKVSLQQRVKEHASSYRTTKLL
jgi:hypothetical protein